jgi:hypothetical protein
VASLPAASNNQTTNSAVSTVAQGATPLSLPWHRKPAEMGRHATGASMTSWGAMSDHGRRHGSRADQIKDRGGLSAVMSSGRTRVCVEDGAGRVRLRACAVARNGYAHKRGSERCLEGPE